MWDIMCTKLVFTVVLCFGMLIVTSCEKSGSKKPLFSSDSEEEIFAWGEKQNYCRAFEYTHDENHAIVLLNDMGSGVFLDQIYIYGKSKGMKKWRLVLFRPTDIEVTVHQENDKLIFKNESSDTKDVILEQSLETLGPFNRLL